MVTQKRILVGAHYGFRDWLVQRLTAVVLALYLFYFVIRVLTLTPNSYGLWIQFFNPFTQFFTMLAFVALCWHAWIGVRDIWMDYVKSTALRLFLHMMAITLLIGYVGWAAKVLFQVHTP